VFSTAGAALLITGVDAALLQRKYNIFTGGFLSVDHLKGSGEVAAFLLGSLLEDAAVAGLLAALGLWLSSSLQLGAAARRLAVIVTAVTPLFIADLAAYRILEYLGGAFDLSLMFDLVGRHPAELVAVASAPLGQFSVLVTGIVLAAAASTYLLHRWSPAGAWNSSAARPRWRALVLPLGWALLALCSTTLLRLERQSLDNGLKRKPSGMVLGAIVAWTTDFDRDGYGLLSRVRDPDIFDARIHPYAVDIPGNGVDEDGVGGDLPADYPAYAEPAGISQPWARRPDVVLILLETFRADAVGATLNGRPVTPVLDALGGRGVASAHAWSHNGYTVQSRFHLLSGSLSNLRAGTTIIDDFNANGYETAYFSGQDDSFGGGTLPLGLDRASLFYDARQDPANRYTLFSTPGSLAVPFTVVRDRVTNFLSRRSAGRPLFLYVNFHDTHFPYTHRFVRPLVDQTVLDRSEISAGRRDDLRRMYLNTAANVDNAIGDVLDAVRRTTGREPAVVVTADHGESLFEDGFLGHGFSLDEAQTRIPLIVAGLPMTVEEPWGQARLRDELRAALAQPLADHERPREVAGAGNVFQYLGELETPGQIGFASARGHVTYDFRSGRFQMPGQPARRPSELDEQERPVFLALVRFWESMRVASAAR
jgi:hypothetical protein